jgi:hypothetical protein
MNKSEINERELIRDAVLFILAKRMVTQWTPNALEFRLGRLLPDVDLSREKVLEALEFLLDIGCAATVTTNLGGFFKATSKGVVQAERSNMAWLTFQDDHLPADHSLNNDCPFCGSDTVSTQQISSKIKYVTCCRCHATGPIWNEHQGSLILWRSRSEKEYLNFVNKKSKR